jgi:hypothetical protein
MGPPHAAVHIGASSTAGTSALAHAICLAHTFRLDKLQIVLEHLHVPAADLMQCKKCGCSRPTCLLLPCAAKCVLCSVPVIAERAASAAARRFPISPCTSCAPRLQAHILLGHAVIAVCHCHPGHNDPEGAWQISSLPILLATSLSVRSCPTGQATCLPGQHFRPNA